MTPTETAISIFRKMRSHSCRLTARPSWFATTRTCRAITASFTLPADKDVSRDDVVLGDITIPSVSAGGSVPVTWTGDCPPLPKGNYFIIMNIDPDNTVGETTEEDNMAFRIDELAVLTNNPPVI